MHMLSILRLTRVDWDHEDDGSQQPLQLGVVHVGEMHAHVPQAQRHRQAHKDIGSQPGWEYE